MVLGIAAAFIAVGGLSAAGNRFVAGKADAGLGLLLGLASVVVGVLVLTHTLSWLTTDSDTIGRVRDYLQAHVSWMFPS